MLLKFSVLNVCFLLSVYLRGSAAEDLHSGQTLSKVKLLYYYTSLLNDGGANTTYPEQATGICDFSDISEERADVDVIYSCNRTELDGEGPVLIDGKEGAVLQSNHSRSADYYVFNSNPKPILTFDNSDNACISTIRLFFYEDESSGIFPPETFKVRSSNTSMFKEMMDLVTDASVQQHPSHQHIRVVSLQLSQEPTCERYIKVKFTACTQPCNSSSVYLISELEAFAAASTGSTTGNNSTSSTTQAPPNGTTTSGDDPSPPSLQWLFQEPFARYSIAMLSAVACVLTLLVLAVLACIAATWRRLRQRRRLAKMNPAEKDYAALEFLPVDYPTSAAAGVLLTSMLQGDGGGGEEKTTTAGEPRPVEHLVVTVSSPRQYVDLGPCALESPPLPVQALSQQQQTSGSSVLLGRNVVDYDEYTSTSTLEECLSEPHSRQVSNAQATPSPLVHHHHNPRVSSTAAATAVLPPPTRGGEACCDTSFESFPTPELTVDTSELTQLTSSEDFPPRSKNCYLSSEAVAGDYLSLTNQNNNSNNNNNNNNSTSEKSGETASTGKKEVQGTPTTRQQEIEKLEDDKDSKCPQKHLSPIPPELLPPKPKDTISRQECLTSTGPESRVRHQRSGSDVPAPSSETTAFKQRQRLAREYPNYDVLPPTKSCMEIPTTADGYAYLNIIPPEGTRGGTVDKRKSVPGSSHSSSSSSNSRWNTDNRKSLDLRTRYGYANVDIIDQHCLVPAKPTADSGVDTLHCHLADKKPQVVSRSKQENHTCHKQQQQQRQRSPVVAYGEMEYAAVILPGGDGDGEGMEPKLCPSPPAAAYLDHDYAEIDLPGE